LNKHVLIKFRFEIPSVKRLLKTAKILGGYLFCHTL